MDIKIPKLVQPLDLSEYAPELKGQVLHVWVDPPRKIFQQYDLLVIEAEQKVAEEMEDDAPAQAAVQDEEAPAVLKPFEQLKANLKRLLTIRRKRAESRAEGTDKQILEWYAVIWSQQSGSTWSVRDIMALEEENPSFFAWLIEQTWRMIRENRERNKKK